MKTKCQRCLGSKTYQKVTCVKCSGKGYITEMDLKIFSIAKVFGKKKARKGISLNIPLPNHIEIKKHKNKIYEL